MRWRRRASSCELPAAKLRYDLESCERIGCCSAEEAVLSMCQSSFCLSRFLGQRSSAPSGAASQRRLTRAILAGAAASRKGCTGPRCYLNQMSTRCLKYRSWRSQKQAATVRGRVTTPSHRIGTAGQSRRRGQPMATQSDHPDFSRRAMGQLTLLGAAAIVLLIFALTFVVTNSQTP